jgi:hypothetical protein
LVKKAWPTQPQIASVVDQTPPASSTIMTSSNRPPTS